MTGENARGCCFVVLHLKCYEPALSVANPKQIQCASISFQLNSPSVPLEVGNHSKLTFVFRKCER